jgi:hypothetical protein
MTLQPSRLLCEFARTRPWGSCHALCCHRGLARVRYTASRRPIGSAEDIDAEQSHCDPPHSRILAIRSATDTRAEDRTYAGLRLGSSPEEVKDVFRRAGIRLRL